MVNSLFFTAIISGQETKERVMVWDIRARTLVHELSTGNNSVESLAWDSAHATLYASTSRRNEEYRKSEIPFAFRTRDQDKDIVDEGRQHENYRDGTKFRNAARWPKKAYHPEDYFGYAYDSGGDTICTYVHFLLINLYRRRCFSNLSVQRNL